jgi:hypothetical protein
MREAATTGDFGVASHGACGARRAKSFARAVVLLAGCVFLTACPPDGGDLVPLAPGGGASLATRSFEGDTLSVTRDGVTLGARGLWSVADAATSVILEVSNANAEPAAIDFGRAELSMDGGGGRMTLRSATREFGDAVAFLVDKRVELGGGESATFALEFKMDSGDGRSGVPRDVTGRIVTLRLPVEVRSGAARAADFVFGFEYGRRWTRR